MPPTCGISDSLQIQSAELPWSRPTDDPHPTAVCRIGLSEVFRNVSFKFTTFDQNENQKAAVPIQSRKNVKFDTPAQIKAEAARIRAVAVTTKTMPLGNQTKMTQAERVLLGRWIADGWRSSSEAPGNGAFTQFNNLCSLASWQGWSRPTAFQNGCPRRIAVRCLIGPGGRSYHRPDGSTLAHDPNL